MSEAELHILRSRLDAGKKNKAKRGEYVSEAPLGYVRTHGGVELEPDAQAQGVVRLLFDKFAELGSAHAVLKFFHKEEILIGRRAINGLRPSGVTWHRANRSTLLYVLRHPIYAGAYVYGRSKSVTVIGPNGTRKTVQRPVSKEEWEVLIRDKVPAYITWEQWERNQRKLKENSTRFGCGVSRGASILAGRVACGKCGASMSVHYHDGVPTFDCCLANLQYGGNDCQTLNGRWLEPMIEELVLQAFEPASIQHTKNCLDVWRTRRLEGTAHTAQHLYNAGCPRPELIRRLNDEGFRPARKSQFTESNINALMLVLRRKGMISTRPEVAKPLWRSKELSNELGIKPCTLTGWRRRGWVQAKKLGRRWIYWADNADLPRLKKLATHPPCGSTPAPKELTDPAAIMPVSTTWNLDEQPKQGGHCEQIVKAGGAALKMWVVGNDKASARG